VSATTRVVAGLLAIGLVAPACGGNNSNGAPSEPTGTGGVALSSVAPGATADLPPLVVDGIISDAALDEVLDIDGNLQSLVLDSYAAEFEALPGDEQATVLSDLSLRTELELSASSGLGDAAGGLDAAEAALLGAAQQIIMASDAAAAAAVEPQGLRMSTPVQAPSGATVATVGLVLGTQSLGTIVADVTQTSNGLVPGETAGNGTTVTATTDKVQIKQSFQGNQDGVDVESSFVASLQPCPAADGTFTIAAVVNVKANKGGVGQNVQMDLTITGQVGDNAELIDKNIDNRVQWSDFGGPRGQFLDFTSAGSTGLDQMTRNRTGGAVTDDFAAMATSLGKLTGFTVANQLLAAAEKAWKSGRCVMLNVTPSAGPSGLSPSEVVSVLAEPRSKLDGQPTGGNVTATLTTGGATVEPDGSPVPADANSNYTAPDQADQTGNVAYESRSRRGVGKASVTFDTKRRRYTASGGGTDITISGTVAALNEPFILDGQFIGGVATFSYDGDELGGTLEVSGGGSGATLNGDGAYTIADNGDGTKTLTQTVSACVDVSGVCNTTTQVITLTPQA
jgi:hypothetical protein